MKVFVVHVYDNAGRLQDFYVCGTAEGAARQAATDVVNGRFAGETLREIETRRVVDTIYEEPGVGRWHVRCDTWLAHVDTMEVRP